MVTFTTMIDKTKPVLVNDIVEMAHDETVEPYNWMGLYMYITHQDILHGVGVIGDANPLLPEMSKEDQLGYAIKTIDRMLYEEPIFYIDKALETLIEDTVPSLNDIRVPYPCFYINKRFKIGDTIIMGFFVQNMELYLRHSLAKTGRSKKEADMIIKEMRNSPQIKGKFPDISYTYVAVEPDRIVITIGDEEDVLIAGNIDKHTKKIMKQVMFFSINVCDLITSRVNLKNPIDTSKDVRIVPHYPKEKSIVTDGRKTPYSYIKVFGDLKTYVQDYTKTKRKYTHNVDSYLVRGHWRVFKSERYVNVRGEKKWILPFVKGANQELHQKLIKLKE